jgi:hypothetical protein
LLAARAGLPADDLSQSDRLHRELFARLYQDDLERYAWGLRFLPVTQRRGIQSAIGELRRKEPLPDVTMRSLPQRS